jgi:lambda family phage portal protein
MVMGLRSWWKQAWRSGLQPKRRTEQRLLEAARLSRLTADFLATNTSADAELRGGLREVRNRCRQLCRDNPYARQAKRTTIVNIVGAKGITLHGAIKKLSTSEKDERRNALLEESWKRWCKRKHCDVSGQKSFLQIESLVVSSLPESGEAIVRIVRQAFGGSKVPLALELIEADQLDETYSGPSQFAGRTWRMGIETDKWGRPTRYALLEQHPGDADLAKKQMGQRHIFVDAKDIIHIFLPERIGQTRGNPWIAPVVLTAHNLGEYEKAHWTRKRVQAGSLGFIIPGDPEFPQGEIDEDGNPVTINGERIIDSKPGGWNVLLPGDEIRPPDFGPDDGQYENIVRNLVRRFASGYGCSYETVSRDYSNTSYSSARTATLEDRDHWRFVQAMLIEVFHQRVFEEWIEAAILHGELSQKLFGDFWVRPERYLNVRWQPRSWPWVDPAKELKALEIARQLLLETHSEQIENYSGGEFEEVVAQLALENKIKKRLGLFADAPDVNSPSGDNVSTQQEQTDVSQAP